MNGMRDMLVLCYWLDNSKGQLLETSLTDRRKLPKEKATILKELAEEPPLHDSSPANRQADK